MHPLANVSEIFLQHVTNCRWIMVTGIDGGVIRMKVGLVSSICTGQAVHKKQEEDYPKMDSCGSPVTLLHLE